MGYIFYVCAIVAEFGCEWVVVIADSKDNALAKLTKQNLAHYNEVDLNGNDIPIRQGTPIRIIE